MADRKNPFTQIGFAKYEGIHRMPSALKARAITHESNRQRVVASLFVDLHIMAVLGIIPPGKSFTVRGASFQNLEGSSEKMTQAAHCSPRQLYIGAETPQALLRRVFPERAWAMEVLFAETDILPVNFNICDSRAERHGLNEAFRSACQYVVIAGLNEPIADLGVMDVKLENAYAVYRTKAEHAYESAVESLKRKLKPKYLFPAEKAKWTEQLLITEQYIETLRESTGKESGMSRPKIAGLLQEYKLNHNGRSRTP